MSIAHIILITIPLFFSHIFSRIGIIFGDGSSFERMKVYLFLFLALALFIETLIMRRDELQTSFKKWYWVILLFVSLPLFSLGSALGGFFLGSYEKHHGYLFWIGIIIFSLCMSTIQEKKSLISTSLITASVVALIGILEYFGWTLMNEDGDTSWGVWRIISTLGNPNYVAGYLLVHVPLIYLIEKKYRPYLFAPLVMGILLTGSYIGIALMIIYILLVFSRKLHKKGPLVVLVTSLIILSGLWQIIPEEKKLSLQTRGILMSETWVGYINSPQNMLTGNGPDSIITYFSGPRSESVRAYIGDAYVIDSSHSIFIDMLYSYGLIVFGIIGWMIVKNIPILDTPARDGLILGLVFFGMNVIVLAPLLVMILLAQTKKKT